MKISSWVFLSEAVDMYSLPECRRLNGRSGKIWKKINWTHINMLLGRNWEIAKLHLYLRKVS